MKKHTPMRWWPYAILVLGVSVCLIGALVMVVGESILGENHSGIAAVIGIVGIGLIGTSGAMFSARTAMSQKPKRESLGLGG